MNITNTFFSVAVPIDCATVYFMPAKGVTLAGYAFAEFEAARNAIKGAFAQPNWDGYGALPIGDETRKNALGALGALENLTCAPEITQNPNGTVSFEWETNRGYGQLEIGRTRYSFYVGPHKGSLFLDNGDAGDVNHAVGLLVDALLYPKPSHPITAPNR
ncbi:MAG: hypothetical protein M1453_00525 [Acidobacteria bacterium]|nr:hypothetical protein [Acidobacteriota bacterium]MCL5286470.1 hypothetical protein [Acidobacteriota bacterium]